MGKKRLCCFKPWYRILKAKDNELKARGDDNPDIYKYMGYFEFSGAYRYNEHEFSFMSRNNLNSDNRGAINLIGLPAVGTVTWLRTIFQRLW